jgi:toxin-antitoxin system PIN domain toxin
VIAVDTNILVYAHRTEAPKHERALQWLTNLAEGNIPWCLPVFCLGEFVRVVTHRSIFEPPSSLQQALEALDGLLASPSIRLLSPASHYFELLSKTLRSAEATGNMAFDAQIAAVCREHGVRTLLTADRDFSRFVGLYVLTLDADPGDL